MVHHNSVYLIPFHVQKYDLELWEVFYHLISFYHLGYISDIYNTTKRDQGT